MPFVSKAQQRKMFATDPVAAKEWAEKTDFTKLPERVGKRTKDTEKKGLYLMSSIAKFGEIAAEHLLVEKLASATQITPELVRHLAVRANMPVGTFVKTAFADPTDYTTFLQLVTGTGTVKTAGVLGTLAQRIANAAKATVGKGPSEGGFFGKSQGSGPVGQFMAKNSPLGGSQAGRVATGVGVGGAGTAGVASAMSPSKPAAPPAPAAQPPAAAPKPPQQTPAGSNGPAPNTETSRGSLSPVSKGLLGAGAGAVGALGVGAAMRKKKKKEVTASDLSLPERAKLVMRQAILTKAASILREKAAKDFVYGLDKLAAAMPADKTMQVRVVQGLVEDGHPLVYAIKVAYPQLTGEERGILAYSLCKFAAKAKMPFRVQERQEATVKPKDAGKQMTAMCA